MIHPDPIIQDIILLRLSMQRNDLAIKELIKLLRALEFKSRGFNV